MKHYSAVSSCDYHPLELCAGIYINFYHIIVQIASQVTSELTTFFIAHWLVFLLEFIQTYK